MNDKIITVFIFLSCSIFISGEIRYDDFSLYKAVPEVVDHVRFLQNLETQKYLDLIFWQRAHKLFEDVHFIVNPKDEQNFLERTNHFGITVKKLLKNVQEAFDAQAERKTMYLRAHPVNYTWDTYHSLADINQWLADIALLYPKILKLESIGKSVEGRDIFAVEFHKRKTREKVMIVGGIHGNEWVAVEFVTFLINELLKAANDSNSNLYNIANAYSWYLVPLLNPDGYQYSQNVDRMWKKNRKSIDGGRRVGVNLDRNFDYSFGKYDSSFDPADDNFCGTAALSEPETQAFADYVNRNSHNLKFYFSFHAYGQKIVIPYGDTVIHQENFGEMENYAKQAILKMYKRSGIKYRTGTTYDALGLKISGDSASWAKKVHHVKYVYTMLLRDDGTYGYALPKEQILPTCKETIDGLIEIMTAKPRKLRTDMFSSNCTSLCKSISVSICLIIVVFLNYLS